MVHLTKGKARGTEQSSCPAASCERRGPERVSDWLEVTQHVGGSTGTRQGPPDPRAPPEVRAPLSLSQEGHLAAEPAAAFRGARWTGFLGCGPSLDQEVDSPRRLGTLLPLVATWGGAGSRGEQMSACPYVEVAQMLPHLGCGGGRKQRAGTQVCRMTEPERGGVSHGWCGRRVTPAGNQAEAS